MKNDGYIEALPDDASIGLIDDVKRKASAIQESAKVTAAVEQVEVTKQKGAEQEAKLKETPEGEVAEEVALSSPGASIAVNLGEKLLEDSENPSNSGAKDVQEAVARGARSMEDSFTDIKKAPIQAPFNQPLGEKASILAKSMKSFSSGDTKGVQSSSSAVTSTLKTSQTLDFGKSLANEAKLNRAVALERQQAPSPHGMGAPGLNNNSYAQGPKGPNFNDDEALA